MVFNWIGQANIYGELLPFFSITAFNVEQIFYIYKSTLEDDKQIFYIKNAKNVNTKLVSIEDEVDEKINYIHLIETDKDFRKKYKRSYNLLKIECDNNTIVTIGSYTDSKSKPTADNSYILCQTDFVNILAESKHINTVEDIYNTPFEELGSILNKKELTKHLLK